jgi:hypothetical protein
MNLAWKAIKTASNDKGVFIIKNNQKPYQMKKDWLKIRIISLILFKKWLYYVWLP